MVTKRERGRQTERQRQRLLQGYKPHEEDMIPLGNQESPIGFK